MLWHDLLFDKALDDGTLADGFACAFGVRPDQVAVTGNLDLETWDRLREAPIVIELRPGAGQFLFGVSPRLRSPETERAVATAAQGEAIIARLCALWQAHCLFDDGTVNPYGYVRMHPSGRVDHVTLDAAALDERDEYTVASSRPRTPPITPSAIG